MFLFSSNAVARLIHVQLDACGRTPRLSALARCSAPRAPYPSPMSPVDQHEDRRERAHRATHSAERSAEQPRTDLLTERGLALLLD